MASAEVASRTQDRPPRRRPFANLVKRLANLKNNTDQQERGNGRRLTTGGMNFKPRKNDQNGFGKSRVYPESGHLRVPQPVSQPSLTGASPSQYGDGTSYSSLPSAAQDRESHSHGNKSGAPTLATNAETLHSEAGQSKAATSTTAGGALSMDGAGAGSTFSSPNQSVRSLATTLTTVQSTSQGNTTQNGQGVSSPHTSNHHNQHSQPVGSMFSHQYPILPMQNQPATASAIPRHVATDSNATNTLNSPTAANVLTDNASILTLASSSKRRRRSMDTDASVRALAPSSMWGGSRESLPLSVLSGHVGSPSTDARTTMGNVNSPSAERASVYSSSGLTRDRDSIGFISPALASERNSLYAKQDAKSMRSSTHIDSRSQYDGKSITNADARSTHDVASLRSIAPSEARHARNESITGSIGASPVAAPSSLRHSSLGHAGLSTSRTSISWADVENEVDKDGADEAAMQDSEANGVHNAS